MENKSLWTRTTHLSSYPILNKNIKTGTVIIGGGMTGLLCGYYLNQQNQDYMIVEQNTIAKHTTAGTTAKITTQHGLVYGNLLKYQGKEIAQGYFQANKQAMKTLIQLAQTIDCDFQYQTNLIYDMETQDAIEAEINALEEIGGEGTLIQNPNMLPVKPKAALAVQHQGQFHPLKFLNAIAQEQSQSESQNHIFHHTKAVDICKDKDGYRVIVLSGPAQSIHTIFAQEVIIATHFPFKNIRGLYFMKMHQARSYAILLEGVDKEKLPPFMAMGSQPTDLSLRTYQDKLILGGRGGKTGEKHGGVLQLIEDAENYYPEANVTQSWAAQDCMSLDQMPYIGNHNPSLPGVKVATGYNKWGMTNSMVAALALTGQMDKELANIFYPHRTMVQPQLLSNLATSTKNLITFKKPRCSHLGCALQWNSAERSWDCPCHGSRYNRQGDILNEPAQDPIVPPTIS